VSEYIMINPYSMTHTIGDVSTSIGSVMQNPLV
jgi:hypothetical protein